MLILGIETSCDETGASVVKHQKGKKTVKVLSNVVSSSLSLHAKTGGIIPEVAAREQIKFIIPVIKTALGEAGLNLSNPEIDAIALTYGPGLIGSLLVGVETAKTLSYVWNKKIIPVNHLIGHIYANFIEEEQKENIHFPAVCLVVSGGHTDLVILTQKNEIKWLGGTRDDAAGEALDKVGRLLNLPYPAGAKIEELAKKGKDIYKFPRPLIDSGDFDFSFSGLKTAVLREVKKIGKMDNQTVANLCMSVQSAVIDVLVKKTLKAANAYKSESILLSGGVAANSMLRFELRKAILSNNHKIKLHAPSPKYCTDNAAMIASAGSFIGEKVNFGRVEANPQLYFK